MTGQRSPSRERQPRGSPRLLVGAAVLAALVASALPIWGGADDLDLEAVIPGTSQVVSGATGDDASAVAILAAVPLVAAVPLILGMRRWAILAGTVVVGGFAVVTITRLGLLYVPSALLLLAAARRSNQ